MNRTKNPLSVFRYRDFALAWSATSLVTMGTQMEGVVLGWFILNKTDSPFLMGAIWAARMSLNITSLLAGALADRIPRHKILAAVNFITGVLSLIMLLLIMSGKSEMWHIFVIVVIAGMVQVFQMPSAQALVADTLPEDRISNGAAFNTLGRNVSMLLGPLVGGILFKFSGPEGAYTAVAALYFLSGLVAMNIRSSGISEDRKQESLVRTMIDGLKYIRSQQALWATLALVLIIESSGWTFHTTLVPIFARNQLGTDSFGLGVLLFAFGIGAVVASVAWAMVGELQRVGKSMIVSAVVWHASILLFATSPSFFLSMLILTVTGAGFASTQVFMLASLLGNSHPDFRGRVLSVRSLAIYAFALGSMSSGAIAEIWGAPVAATIVGTMGIVLVVLLAILAPRLRNI